MRLSEADHQVEFLAFKIRVALALIDNNWQDKELQRFLRDQPISLADILRAETYP